MVLKLCVGTRSLLLYDLSTPVICISFPSPHSSIPSPLFPSFILLSHFFHSHLLTLPRGSEYDSQGAADSLCSISRYAEGHSKNTQPISAKLSLRARRCGGQSRRLPPPPRHQPLAKRPEWLQYWVKQTPQRGGRGGWVGARVAVRGLKGLHWAASVERVGGKWLVHHGATHTVSSLE